MTWKATVREPLGPVAEGEYEAMLNGIQTLKGPHGPIVRLHFILRGGDEIDGRVVTGVASKRLSEDTKLGRWISAILGRDLEQGESISENDILHRDCRIVVRHRTGDDGRVFANVAELRALKA